MEKMWKRLIAALAVVLTAPVLLCICAFGLPAQYEDTFLGALRDKYDALQSTTGSRIIFVGGSGVAFGLRSDLLEEELPGYRVINFGMYAGLGSTVMLELAEPLLQPGDIVIFSPEQSRQTLSMYLNAEAMWQAADGNFDLLQGVQPEEYGSMAGQFPYFAAKKARYFFTSTAPLPEGVYARTSFNRYGDISYGDRGQNVMPLGWDVNMPIDFDLQYPGEAFIDYINEYHARCQERGIWFFYQFCPMNKAAVTEAGFKRMDDYVQYLEKQLECHILGTLSDAVMDPGWFYDTNFHLNSDGAITRTATIARDLKSELGLTGPVKIAVPAMPLFADTEVSAGDNHHAHYFLYEDTETGVILTGLTPEGQTQTVIMVPAVVDGRPVLTFDRDVFAGNTVIREITIQSNIRQIPDGAFDGCRSLERIVVANLTPEQCTVGSGLLDGTNVALYVPEQTLSQYLTNYFWSVHSDSIHGMSIPGLDLEQNPEQNQPTHNCITIRYLANGGIRKDGAGETMDLTVPATHLRVNTAQGTRYFIRDGWVLTGWNTAPDGTGTAVGLGSRIEKMENLVLYAQWEQETDPTAFSYRIENGEIHITAYHGGDGTCVIPEAIEDLPVTRICEDAFRDLCLERLVLPQSMFRVDIGAFENCAVEELVLFDSLYYIYDESFRQCGMRTLHINACTAPVYSGSYFDAFSDKYDWLLSIRDQKKIVLFSGSSARYGYDSETLIQAFPEYQVANMGVYAYTGAMPQYDLILDLMNPGDILLSAPEFDSVNHQFCTTNALDSLFWAMMESNYDAVTNLDLGDYTGVFDSLREYLTTRSSMQPRDYSESPSWYDDDGNRYDYATYNRYGDFTLKRPDAPEGSIFGWGRPDYTVDGFPLETVECLNSVYRKFLQAGVRVYFTYTPRNILAISETSTPAARAELHDYLCRNICAPVISEIESSLFDSRYFYLIDSHLSDNGVALRMERIVQELQAQFDTETQDMIK